MTMIKDFNQGTLKELMKMFQKN